MRRRASDHYRETITQAAEVIAPIGCLGEVHIGHLRAIWSGRAQYSMQFDHCAVAPARVLAELPAA